MKTRLASQTGFLLDCGAGKNYAFLQVWPHQINMRGFLRILKYVSTEVLG